MWAPTLAVALVLSGLLLQFEFQYLENKLYGLHTIHGLIPPGITRSPFWVNGLLTFISTASVLYWITYSSPIYGGISTIALAITLIGISHIALQLRGIWIRDVLPLVGIFIGYYLAVPLRLIREYKARWELQRFNEVHGQVEEMKNHFISLVTHDLKTPVAKIQGLAEVTLRLAQKHQDQSELIALDHLLHATEELDHFITQILELTRIESNRIQLKIESKDINALIEKVITRFDQQISDKHISIDLRLEPIFPIKLDSELTYKVLSNILDNALKYAPPQSTILIQSKEESDWIHVTISDQGIGMTQEELSKLFSRFFRGKNEVTATYPGTGLGLYLSKYFIEAQGGRVEAVSKPQQGSKFTIRLPISTRPHTEKTAQPVFAADSPKENLHV